MELPTNTDITNRIPCSGIPPFRLIEVQLNRVRELINKQLTVPAKTDEISQLLEYMKARSGKMLRPGLVLLAGGVVGEITDKHMQAAAIV